MAISTIPSPHWGEGEGEGEKVSGPKMIDSMLFSLCANARKGAAKYVGLTPDVSGGAT